MSDSHNDFLAGLPPSTDFLHQLDAWRWSQDDPPSRDVAVWLLACGLSTVPEAEMGEIEE